jgi:hypothetical protein
MDNEAKEGTSAPGSDGWQEAVTQARFLYRVFDAIEIERPSLLAASNSDYSGAEAALVQVRGFPVTTMHKPRRQR